MYSVASLHRWTFLHDICVKWLAYSYFSFCNTDQLDKSLFFNVNMGWSLDILIFVMIKIPGQYTVNKCRYLCTALLKYFWLLWNRSYLFTVIILMASTHNLAIDSWWLKKCFFLLLKMNWRNLVLITAHDNLAGMTFTILVT